MIVIRIRSTCGCASHHVTRFPPMRKHKIIFVGHRTDDNSTGLKVLILSLSPYYHECLCLLT